MRRLGPDAGETIRKLGMLSALGIAIVLCIAIGTGAGLLLDRWLGTHWLFLPGFFVGVAAAGVTLYRTLDKFGAD